MKSKNNNFHLIELKQSLKGNSVDGGDLIIAIGRFFLGAPYGANTLEPPGSEKLVVNFQEFDCTTFVETVLALAKCASAGKMSRSEFRRTLLLIRYRGDTLDGYSSRLHYFTDWLRDNEKKKILKDIGRHLGGQPQRKEINFMTSHRAAYPALRNEDEFQKMLAVEKNISRKVFQVIGNDEVTSQTAKIQNGDIIAFVATQDGLDVAHTGFACRQGNNLHLLHASSKEGAVAISEKTLAAFLKSNKKFTGVIAARPCISAPLSNRI